MTALRRDWQEMSIPNDRAAMKWPTVIDCVVVGAGPAGLAEHFGPPAPRIPRPTTLRSPVE